MIFCDRTSSGYDRLTCTVCDKALVRQPHMGGLRWIHERAAFQKKHYRCERIGTATFRPTDAVATQAANAEVCEKAGELAGEVGGAGPEGNSRA